MGHNQIVDSGEKDQFQQYRCGYDDYQMALKMMKMEDSLLKVLLTDGKSGKGSDIRSSECCSQWCI